MCVCVCVNVPNNLFMVFEARRFHWTLGLGKYLNIRHNFSSSFPFELLHATRGTHSLAWNDKKEKKRWNERTNEIRWMERTKQQTSKNSIYFHFACCFSPFLFYICVSVIAPLFPFPYQAWGKPRIIIMLWCMQQRLKPYSEVHCNTVFYSFNFPCNEMSSLIFNENSSSKQKWII